MGILFFNLSLLLAGLCLFQKAGASEREGKAPAHFFNAQGLTPGTYQINALSQVKVAISDDLELNTITAAYLFRPTFWNIGIKHKMFKTERVLTSFNSHSFIFKSSSDLYMASLHGIVSSVSIDNSHSLNFGLMDGLVMTFAPTTQSSLHLITPLIGWDWVRNRNWSLSAMFARPIYAIGQLVSDESGEGNLQIDFTRKNYNPGLGFISSSYVWDSYRLEMGAVYISIETGSFAPYLNFFWSFGA